MLRQLWVVEAHSSARVAAIMGISRSAVIGKACRMGWARGTGANDRNNRLAHSGPPDWRRRAQASAERKAAFANRPRPPYMPPAPLPESVEREIPPHQRKTLMQLEAGDCRWPIGNPGEAGFHFCARQKVSGYSYCADHVRRAYYGTAAAPTITSEVRKDVAA